MANNSPDEQYGELLDKYITDLKQNDLMEKEIKEMAVFDYFFSPTIFDQIFPLHVKLK